MTDELDELYRVRPEDFTALRTRLASAAKQRGDTDAAKRISAAHKPTTAAWLVNRLALGDTAAAHRLADLGERLRAAHAAMDGDRIRELSARRRRAIRELTRAAFQTAELTDPPAALRHAVTDTLQAAIADPHVAGQLGRLTKAQSYSGFGELGDASAVRSAGTSGDAKPTPARDRQQGPDASPRGDVKAGRRQHETATAALAAAERTKAGADATLSDRQADLDAARRHHDQARKALHEAERNVNAAEDAYQVAEQASREAAELVKNAKAILKQRGITASRGAGTSRTAR